MRSCGKIELPVPEGHEGLAILNQIRAAIIATGQPPFEIDYAIRGAIVKMRNKPKPVVVADTSTIYLDFPLMNGDIWYLRKTHLVELWRTYNVVLDVLGECKKARIWCVANTTKRKTMGGMYDFLVNWMNKAIKMKSQLPPKAKEAARADAEQQARAMVARLRGKGDVEGVAGIVDNVIPMDAALTKGIG